jgi:hypothetical protein
MKMIQCVINQTLQFPWSEIEDQKESQFIAIERVLVMKRSWRALL